MAKDLAPDWILKEALATSHTAHMSFVNSKPELRSAYAQPDDGALTLAVLGCGSLGTAILEGILDSSEISDTTSVTANPPRVPSKFNACVRSRKSAERVKKELARHDANVRVYENDSLGAVRAADVVLLCVQPQQVADLFATAGICEALSEKLLISVLPGFTEQQLHGMIHANLPSSNQPESLIVRAIPNAAAAVRESMTVIGVSSLHLASERKALVDWIFTRIGKVIWVPSPSLDTYFALCGSGPAFYALLAESLATSAIAMGLQRDQAHELAAQTMRGTSGLLLRGDHPACVRERTSTPGGGTAAGLQVLEESGLRTTISKAFQQSKLPRGE